MYHQFRKQIKLSPKYFARFDSPPRGSRLTSVDPEGMLARTIPIYAAIGDVMNKPADLLEPGRTRLADQAADRLVIGEFDNRITPRLASITDVIEPAGSPKTTADCARLRS